MTDFKRQIPFLIAACLLIAATSVAALAQGENSLPSDSSSQVTTIEEEAQDAMTVLDEPRTTGDEMPTDAAEKIDEEAPFGMNPDLSRRSIGSVSNSIYVIPGDDHICIAFTTAESTQLGCRRTEDVVSGEAPPATLLLDGGALGVYGIVPDDVEAVTVETGESHTDIVEVEENAYYIALPAETPLRTVSYTGPSGEVEYPIYDPHEAFENE